MNLFELLLGPSLISATLRLTVPILFVAVGGCFGSKANVFNIGLESYPWDQRVLRHVRQLLEPEPLGGSSFGNACRAGDVLYFRCVCAVF